MNLSSATFVITSVLDFVLSLNHMILHLCSPNLLCFEIRCRTVQKFTSNYARLLCQWVLNFLSAVHLSIIGQSSIIVSHVSCTISEMYIKHIVTYNLD